MSTSQSNAIRQFILERVTERPGDIAALTSQAFGISRQAAHRHVRRLVEEGVLVAEGKTKSRRYRKALEQVVRQFAVTPTLEEHKVWQDAALPILRGLPDNVLGICSYGFTEMVNNVIDHSESPSLAVRIERSPTVVRLQIVDIGVGIFEKIQREGGLESPREAIFELTKGKFTTDPERHTGEGIFFTSRMFDSFAILSGRLFLSHRREDQDWLLERRSQTEEGTHVSLQIDPKSDHTTQDVFDYYAAERDDYAFNKTIVALELVSNHQEPLISRSQAKRVLARLEHFKEVVLDFRNVEVIGPAFADEIFRVFGRQHPDIKLIPIHANEKVQAMISRALSQPETRDRDGSSSE